MGIAAPDFKDGERLADELVGVWHEHQVEEQPEGDEPQGEVGLHKWGREARGDDGHDEQPPDVDECLPEPPCPSWTGPRGDSSPPPAHRRSPSTCER